MAYKFRLEGILKLRKEEEKEAQMNLGKLRQEQLKLLNEVKANKETRTAWTNEYNATNSTKDEPANILLIENYLAHLDRYDFYLNDKLRKLEASIIQAISLVQEKHQATKQIQFLKDKSYAEYKKELKIKETKETDDLNMLRFINSTSHMEALEQ